MRAVNLIPVDERRHVAGSGTGLSSYLLLAALALVVAISGAYTLSNRSISDRRQELADVQARVKASSAEAQALQAYTAFTSVRQKRSETVRSLAASRFDWSKALHEVARTIPSNAWLTGLRGTVTPTSAVEGGVSDPLRGSVQSPAIEIVGCTTSQNNVAGVISSLRRIHGVQRVSLSSSTKLEASGGSGGGGDCRSGNVRFPMFSLTMFFAAPSQPTTPTPAQPTTQGTTP
jgi:Tfp pilus assembly protein PilN